ncbi:esterase [Streptomyces tsukubensis]|uniref:Esterase n=1 Tax=Streptomyces tsukubensis TaxID=83656 RepID=A0A1V4A4X0_9ACTN|nr:esterase [Streptomyces tsukubensis]
MHGTVAPGYEQVEAAFRNNFARLGERGAAVAVYREGRKVVDLWGGDRDVDGHRVGGPDADGILGVDGALGVAGGLGVDGALGAAGDGPATSERGTPAPWERGTAQITHSVTKGLAASVLLLLHQRGEIDPDAPVSTYWPQYKAHGKEQTLVRHLLSHRAGVPALDRPLSPAEALDPVAAAAAVAAQAPAWEPGTDHGYHAHTYGWLAGELVRRVTGRTIGTWIAEEIAGPLGLDLWLGLPAHEADRPGRVGPADIPDAGGLRTRPRREVAAAYADPDSLTRRAFGAISPLPDENAPAYRAAELPAANAITTARSLARFYAALIGDVEAETAPGAGLPHARRLFAPATVTLARTEESAGADRVLVVPTRFGPGYMLHSPASPLLGPGSFGHPGRGGPLGFADPDSGVAFGYVTNGMREGVTSDPRAQALVRAVRSAL